MIEKRFYDLIILGIFKQYIIASTSKDFNLSPLPLEASASQIKTWFRVVLAQGFFPMLL